MYIVTTVGEEAVSVNFVICNYDLFPNMIFPSRLVR